VKLALVAVAAFCLAVPAAAQNSPAIRAAKAAGQIGERYDGFIGYASPVSTAARREANAVNIRRRAHYSRLAAAKGVSPLEVGITAGCMTLASVQVGEAYMLADNRWRRRGPGQAVPVPNYCTR
jgi:uncharacterized protein YdbL (DUF1318 family)